MPTDVPKATLPINQLKSADIKDVRSNSNVHRCIIKKMKRSFYKGIALDYTAQEYDDEYSLCNYCNKCYNDSFSTNTSIGSQSSEEYTVKEPYNGNIWSGLKNIFCCYW